MAIMGNNIELSLVLNNLKMKRLNIHKEFNVTAVHNFHQFEQVEWNKLVRVEIKARIKISAGSVKKISKQTELFSSELINTG